jgi:zinc protease
MMALLRRLAAPLSLLLALTLTSAAPLGAQPAPQARPWLYENSDVPIDTAWLLGVLPNGLRYAIRRNTVPPGQVSIRVRVDVGSLMERDSERGFAHYIEHLTFRGSREVPDGESKRIWQRLGATFGSDSNAQTTPVGTTYAVDLPQADAAGIDESMKILAGMMAQPNIVPAAVEAERAVVLAEMREGESPASRAGDATREFLFAGQPLASRSPIGTVATLNAATAETLSAFHDRWYRPERTVIAISGDIDPAQAEDYVKRHFAGWRGAGPATPDPDFGRPTPGAPASRVLVQAGAPAALTLAYLRPWLPRADTIVYNQGKLADALALRLINRRLEQAARASGASFVQASVDQQDLSRSVDATLVSIQPAGPDWARALRDVRAIIEDARTTPPSQADIDRDYADLDTALAIDVENADTEASTAQADRLVGAVDIRETTVTPQAALAIFRGGKPRMTPDNLLAATRRLFTGDATRAMLNLPAAQKDAEAVLAQALAAPVKPATDVRLATGAVTIDSLPRLPPAGKVVSREPAGALAAETIGFANGVRLTLFANNAESGKVRINVRFGHGRQAFAPTDRPAIWAAPYALMASGIGTLGQRELDELTNGRRIQFNFELDDDAFEFNAVSRPADYRDQLRLFATKLAYPRWDPAPIERIKAALLASYDAGQAAPDGVLSRQLGWLLRARDNRYASPGKAEIAALTPAQFRKTWEPVLASGPIEVQVFGDVNAEEAIAAVAETFGALPPRADKPVPAANRTLRFPAPQVQPVVLRHTGDADQAAAIIAWPTAGGYALARQSRHLDVLAQIINDRLFDRLRAADGAAYSPYVTSDFPYVFEQGGYILVVAQVKPDRIPYFYGLVRSIARDLATNPVSADELQRTVLPIRQLLSRVSTGNAYWMNELEGSSRDPRPIAIARSRGVDTMSVTPADIQALAARYLVDGRSWSAVVLPPNAKPPLVTTAVAAR